MPGYSILLIQILNCQLVNWLVKKNRFIRKIAANEYNALFSRKTSALDMI